MIIPIKQQKNAVNQMYLFDLLVANDITPNIRHITVPIKQRTPKPINNAAVTNMSVIIKGCCRVFSPAELHVYFLTFLKSR